MAGPVIEDPPKSEVGIVDPENRNYQKLRAQSPTPDATEKELCFVNKWVARCKSDAAIVASADDYDGLEKMLAELKINPNSVVMGVIYDPSEIYID